MANRLSARLPLLYPAGREHTGDLAEELRPHGWRVDTVIIYRAVMVEQLPPPICAALAAGEVDAVLHYSARTAQAFLAAAAAAGIDGANRFEHLCLSSAVAAPLVAAGAENVQVAAAPNGRGIIRVHRARLSRTRYHYCRESSAICRFRRNGRWSKGWKTRRQFAEQERFVDRPRRPPRTIDGEATELPRARGDAVAATPDAAQPSFSDAVDANAADRHGRLPRRTGSPRIVPARLGAAALFVAVTVLAAALWVVSGRRGDSDTIMARIADIEAQQQE